MWGRGRGRGQNRGGGRGTRGGQWNNRGNRGHGNFSRGFRGGHFNRQNDQPFRNDRNFARNTHFDRQAVIEKLNELDIGVVEFISQLEGFTGVIKSRYSDFHVNEIDLEGKVAKLTDLSIPIDHDPANDEDDDELLVNRYRIEQLPIETWDKIHNMVQSKNKAELIEIDVTPMTKDDRTKIHESVKTVFGQKVVGSTVTKGDKKYVTFKLFNKHDKIDQREKWPKSRGGEFVHFLVYKEYVDTIEAAINISESLHMRPSNFCYAGVKDRRAKTTQWFCVRKVDPSKIVERTKFIKNIQVGNFCYKPDTLRLGQLKGNRFRIALRNVTAEESIINKALESLRDQGFINYYGLQRFGNCKDVPTHEIGKQLLKGNWKEAVELILKPRKQEQDREIATAKQIYLDTGDSAKAYSKLQKKRNRCIEGKLLSGLMKNSANDYVNALENVPRNMRLLYIHAFQSLVWNKMVTKRIKEFGLKPIVGDLVVEGENDDSLANLGTVDGEFDNTEDEPEDETEVKDSKKQVKVKILTEDDLQNYTIYDIVLPLPGYDITYPSNVVKDWYKDLLAEDDLSLEMPKQKVKTYTLSGAYRKVVEKVTNFSWKIMGYSDSTANLIRSDYEELLGKPEPANIPNAKYKALILDFCLSSSCYATMALREVMKMDTSVETHMNFDNKMTQATQTVIKTVTTETQCDSDKKMETDSEQLDKVKTDSEDGLKTATDDSASTGDKRKLAKDDENDVKKIKVE